MSGDREATSKQSSPIREGASYDEVYPSGHNPMEDLTQSLEREPFAHSRTEEDKKDEEEEEEDEEKEEGQDECVQEDDGKEGKDHGEGDETVGGVEDGDQRPFILPLIWMVNGFYLTMSLKVFNNLRVHYQILDHIPMRLPRKFKKCYSGKIADVGLYDAMFIAGLRLPLTQLHHQLANYLGLSVSQIALTPQRIFIGVKVIWGQLSGGNCRLTLKQFFYYYKSQQIYWSKGIYNFLARKPSFRLVLDMLDSNRNWKNKYFFV